MTEFDAYFYDYKFYINGTKEYTLGSILEKYLQKSFKDLKDKLGTCKEYLRVLHYPETYKQMTDCEMIFTEAISFFDRAEEYIHTLPPYNTFLISVEEGTSSEKMQKVFDKYNLEVIYDYENFNMYAVAVPEALDKTESNQFIAELTKKYSFIISVEPDSVMQLDNGINSTGEKDIMVGIANPWQEYKTVSEAAKAAGVDLTAPDKIGKYEISFIQSMKGLVEVNYNNGKTLSASARVSELMM